MALGAQTNNTTFPDGAWPELIRLDLDTFQCPFCHRAGGYPSLMAHLQGHQRSIVKYGGCNVYKCHLGCVASSHYHCGFCPRIIVRKELFLNHFKNCCTPLPTTVVTVALATALTDPATTATAALTTTATSPPVPATTAAPTTAPAAALMTEAMTAPAITATAASATAPATAPTAEAMTAEATTATTAPTTASATAPATALATTSATALATTATIAPTTPPATTATVALATAPVTALTTVPMVATMAPTTAAVTTAPATGRHISTAAPVVDDTQAESIPLYPPERKALVRMTNNTTFPDGACPELKRLDLDTFQCPFCLRAGGYPGLMAHLQAHQRSIVKYGGYNVYKCHLGCVASSHYHCGFCPRIIVRKELFLNHFKNCCTPLPTTVVTMAPATALTAPATTATAAPNTSSTSPPGPTTTAAPTTAPAIAPVAEMTTVAPATTATIIAPATGHHISTARKILMSKLKKTTCCFCNLQLQKKNLKMHMQRHHSSKTSDITANHHLQSVCIDKRRGIFAVSRTFKGPVHCIHVQKCTWGINHQVSCQLEACNRAYDYAQTSGLVGFDCDHVRSLVYSPVATNSTIVLDEGILTEMVVNKWLSKDTESECLRRKLAADTERAPLSVEVNLGQGQGHIYCSVLEPHISSYSRLGRVMVHYDYTKNTWHCPCSKPRKSCPHKSIAKWHLHQSRPDFFTKIETCHEESSETFWAEAAHVDDTQAESIPLYPPEGKALVQMVDYLISHKALLTKLSKNLASLQSSENMPRHLVPQENNFHKCPGQVPLLEPIAISKKAKIVTVTGIVEGRLLVPLPGPTAPPAAPLPGPTASPAAPKVTLLGPLAKRRQNIMQCPLCNLLLNSKNLKMHLQRRHAALVKDITADRNLQSQCIDADRGIYTISKAVQGPSILIHA